MLYCMVLNHLNSASHSMSRSEALPTTAFDTVLEFTRRRATYRQLKLKDLPNVPIYVVARAGFRLTLYIIMCYKILQYFKMHYTVLLILKAGGLDSMPGDNRILVSRPGDQGLGLGLETW